MTVLNSDNVNDCNIKPSADYDDNSDKLILLI